MEFLEDKALTLFEPSICGLNCLPAALHTTQPSARVGALQLGCSSTCTSPQISEEPFQLPVPYLLIDFLAEPGPTVSIFSCCWSKSVSEGCFKPSFFAASSCFKPFRRESFFCGSSNFFLIDLHFFSWHWTPSRGQHPPLHQLVHCFFHSFSLILVN